MKEVPSAGGTGGLLPGTGLIRAGGVLRDDGDGSREYVWDLRYIDAAGLSLLMGLKCNIMRRMRTLM